MSKDFNEDKTFLENYDLNYNFIEILKDEKKYLSDVAFSLLIL